MTFFAFFIQSKKYLVGFGIFRSQKKIKGIIDPLEIELVWVELARFELASR